MKELSAIVERAQLSDEDREKLQAALETLALVTNELETKGTSIRRLRKLLFGSGSSEKLDEVLRQCQLAASEQASQDEATAGAASGGGGQEEKEEEEGSDPPRRKKRKAKGHGRNGASAYAGASKGAGESLPRVREGQGLRLRPSGPGGASPRAGTARCHGVLAQTASLQPVRRSLHGASAS